MAVTQASNTKIQSAAQSSGKKRRKISGGTLIVNGALLFICFLWALPTFGLLVSSFRTREDISTTGWWQIFPHQQWQSAQQIPLERGLPLDQPIQVPALGRSFTDDQLVAGTRLDDGRKVIWANRRQRLVDVQTQQWTTRANFYLNNYASVITGQQYKIQLADGTVREEQGDNLGGAFLNSVTIAVPATIIPILVAAFAAYGFAWMRFPGRKIMFAMIVALLVVPLQVALIPILRIFTALELNGTFLAMWLLHTGFGLPLATYLLFNYISQLPKDIFESAYIDGATPFTIFTRLVLPLSVPALASFAIFQFLWVWNDYLIALVFLGGKPGGAVLTMRLADIIGSRGQDWHLLTAGAFISMLLPLTIFFSLQRFFVRGLLAGSVKG
jgi:alpha-glucoside transport system permease protein